ncbi:unnamed protein product [Echinostoma caproni]|uniref:BZIP domain-containing protein n=1 Tax=Echinostoma caproni TaxID=27848 RepID=A0A183B6R4_9TREM|nr:unnamed protein product [Echinostoma caproni]
MAAEALDAQRRGVQLSGSAVSTAPKEKEESVKMTKSRKRRMRRKQRKQQALLEQELEELEELETQEHNRRLMDMGLLPEGDKQDDADPVPTDAEDTIDAPIVANPASSAASNQAATGNIESRANNSDSTMHKVGAVVVGTARAVVSALGFAASIPLRACNSFRDRAPDDNDSSSAMDRKNTASSRPSSTPVTMLPFILASPYPEEANCVKGGSSNPSQIHCAVRPGRKRAATTSMGSSCSTSSALSRYSSSQSLLQRSILSSGLVPLAGTLIQSLSWPFRRSEYTHFYVTQLLL